MSGNLTVQLKGLEAQIAVLKARLNQQRSSRVEPFGVLYGLLAGKVQSTEEDIEAVEYRLDAKGPKKGEAAP